MQSYSQYKEDIILKLMLHNVKWGHYIDIGANSPHINSVTKLFYEDGWDGINIEPLPDAYESLCESRLKDINLNIGIGKEPAKLALYINGMGSSFNRLDGCHSIEVPVNTITEVYHKYCKDWSDIHFCKIDVEGFEREVLEGVEDWEEFRPWIFCIESTIPGTDIPCYDKWEHILLEHEYELVFEHGINRYYRDIRRTL